MLHGYAVSAQLYFLFVWITWWHRFLHVEVSVWSTQACLDSIRGTRGNSLTLKHASPISGRCRKAEEAEAAR